MGCTLSRDCLSEEVEVYVSRTDAGSIDTLVTALIMPTTAHKDYGAPQSVWVTIRFLPPSETAIGVDVQWSDKTPTRLSETTFLAIPFVPCAEGVWEVDKLGSWVSMLDVVPSGGAAHLNAVGDGGVRSR